MTARKASLALGVALLMLPASAHAATVTSNGDSGAGTLRDTIAAASSGDTIDFSPAVQGQTITLATPIAITKNLTIQGSGGGSPGPTLSGNTTLLSVNATSSLTLGGLTISGANLPPAPQQGSASDAGADGGANVLESHGTMALTEVVVTGNTAGDGGENDGGGGAGGGGSVVASTGTLTITRSTLSGNRGGEGGMSGLTGGGGAGGGIVASSGTLTITDSTLSGNTGGAGGLVVRSGGGGAGGGTVLSTGTLTIRNSTVANNVAGPGGDSSFVAPGRSGSVGAGGGGGFGAGGGGFEDAGGSGFFGNGGSAAVAAAHGAGGGGGGGHDGQPNSGLAGGAGGGSGGGAGGGSGGGSRGGGGGGGDGGGGGGAPGTQPATGGAGGTGGGAGADAGATGGGGSGGSTNGVSDGGGGGTGSGAVMVYGGTLTIDNSTFSGNSRSGGGLSNSNGTDGTEGAGAVVQMAGTASAHSSILADTAPGNQCRGTLMGDHNLVEAPQGCTLPGDTINSDPQLAALADNGGPTQTMAPAPASPAIAVGSNPTSLAFDQRGTGFPRSVGATDIGAFELQRFVHVVNALAPASDGGKFDLRIDGNTRASGVGDGGDTGLVGVDGSTAAVSVAGAGGTDLSLYDLAIDCRSSDGSGGAVTATANGTGQWTVPVASPDRVRCTVTETYRPKVTLTSSLAPAGNAGRFDLSVNGTGVAAGVGDGGSGSARVAGGASTSVGETAAGGTALSAYDVTIDCGGGPQSGASTTITPTVDTTCAVANRYRPEITVVHRSSPPSDPGRFDLFVNAPAVARAVGDGGSGSARVALGSTVLVGESAASGTDANDYSSTVECDGGVSGSAPFVANDDTSCTITATRKPPEPKPATARISHRRVTLSHGRALVKVLCRGATGQTCRGKLTLRSTSKRRRGHAAEAGKSAAFTIPAGHAKTLRVRVPATTRRQLARRHRAVVRATISLTRGARRTTELTVIR